MDIGIGPLASIAKSGGALVRALIGSPLRITVLEGEQRHQVIRDAVAQHRAIPRAIPRWVPGNPDTPPATEMFDVIRLPESIDDVARTQQWMAVDQDRIVLHVYNKSDDAVFFDDVTAEARIVDVSEPWPGCVVAFGAGGNQVKTFGLEVVLYTDRPCSVSARLDSDRQGLTSRTFQLGPRESVHLLVDAFVGIGETARVIEWWLRFQIDANRGIRSRRQTRAPAGRKYRLLGPRRSFRIVNGVEATRFASAWNAEATAFTWQRQPSIPFRSEPDWDTV